jgi:glycogen debranching enzyme
MESRMRKNGIGTIGEVYDSSSPFFEGGCVSQAWSVAEVIRIKYLVDKYKNKEL